MIVEIRTKNGDSDKFLAAVSSLIATMVAEKKPRDLYVTRINKWFDQKWLGYSGSGRVEFEGGVYANRHGAGRDLAGQAHVSTIQSKANRSATVLAQKGRWDLRWSRGPKVDSQAEASIERQ